MATHPLFNEIEKFNLWAKGQSEISQDDRGGEWECSYDQWSRIYSSFEDFIKSVDSETWIQQEKVKLLYIIARDNETEKLAGILPEKELIALTKESIINGQRDDKWQLAKQLRKLSDKHLAESLLDKLVNDQDEYVSRVSLMELAKLGSDKVESYCELFWERDIYGDYNEYQRMAALYSLHITNSKLLDKYIALAKKDGRQYLFANALALEQKSR